MKIKRKPIRTISGVAPLAVMLPPRPCTHGACLYCPSLNAPQSYTPKSPAVLRAISCDYDAFKQVTTRLKSLNAMGHPTGKIELIIMGGTFLSYPKNFQFKFIKKCYDALNGKKSKSLEEAKKINETAEHRAIAICIETRPDVCTNKDIRKMLEWGATRVELGVQAIDDEIYKKINRGHTVQDVVNATKRLKNSGFKVGYHLMINLPGADFEKDIKMIKKIFSDKRFKPDQIKIYPCQVIKGAELEKLYWGKKYSPYSREKLSSLLFKIKSIVPRYCRIMRIMREIPSEYLVAGTIRTDLRKEIQEEMIKQGKECKCIRCREIGISLMNRKSFDPKSIKLCRIDYDASEGKEIFLSFEDIKNNILIGLLRLRIPNEQIVKEIDIKTAIVREMHTYGKSLKIGNKDKELWQHKGYGKLLLKEAEKIAKKEFGKDKIVVIAGVGVREYFYNQGYKIDGTYVSKKLI